MKTLHSVALGLTTAVVLSVVTACTRTATEPVDPADTVYTNGKIYTVNEAQPWAEAVAITDGKFTAVGSAADVKTLIGDGTEVIDLKGSFAMPGIHDTHVHPTLVYTYEEAGELLFPESTPPDEIIEIIKDYAENNPDLTIIRAQKWSAGAFPGGKATKEWLDPHFPDLAVYAIDETGHNAVVNSAALRLAGITKDTPDPVPVLTVYNGEIRKRVKARCQIRSWCRSEI